MFEKLGTNPARDIADRALMHLRWCRQKINAKTATPKSAEDLYVTGVAALNTRNLDGAIERLSKAAKIDPSKEHIHYGLAAAFAVAGNSDAALDSLKTAIHLRPGNWGQARHDEDFQSLVDDPRFFSLAPSLKL